jgi:lipoprotein NlpI
VEAARDATDHSEAGFACRHFKAKALTRQGLDGAALEELSACLHGKALDQYPELAKGIRYDRAVLYALLGRSALAHRDFEHLYAADPSFEGVRERLGVTASPHTTAADSPEAKADASAAAAAPHER